MISIRSLLSELVQFKSITPNDDGCQEYMMHFFNQLGFTCFQFNNPPVANFFAHIGKKGPLLVFAGHTDVVPVGNREQWRTEPFELIEQNGIAYARGAADMKGSLAAMMAMAEQVVANNHPLQGSLGFLITSGEEGSLFDQGTPYVMSELQKLGIQPDYCIVGEPSSQYMLGDTIKVGRRGSLTGNITVQGKQGHVAYPRLAQNPIHQLAPALAELTNAQWDNGNEFFPPTSLQITHIQSGGQAENIIPGELLLQFNFRFSTEQTVTGIQTQVQECFKKYGIQSVIKWRLNGEPFLTNHGKLLDNSIKVITEVTGQKPHLSTDGGTSDGRFIAPYGVEVIELGPINKTIHQVNECVSLADLEVLREIYFLICKQLLIN
ncbi:succinyl-diaminopimelate desuccinylase [Legionella beliardensis]|uniref:Succinyl-diaminopimelate desuccinylase n=1 Tax=Legionella beliardensis TaxID=91822 RepID=A0A378I8E6_9GAMM|nr:succinyl-diaminopimelate desuccinylase [Legionella beliardensis]STX28654.1 succinyl-diaminopimelate desuccinylase [Legionella beliardensis]